MTTRRLIEIGYHRGVTWGTDAGGTSGGNNEKGAGGCGLAATLAGLAVAGFAVSDLAVSDLTLAGLAVASFGVVDFAVAAAAGLVPVGLVLAVGTSAISGLSSKTPIGSNASGGTKSGGRSGRWSSLSNCRASTGRSGR